MKAWIGLLVIASLLGCNTSKHQPEDQVPVGQPIAAVQAAKMVRNGAAFLVDVREEQEIMFGMAEPAIWMPQSLIKQEHPAYRKLIERFEKEPSKPVILYCRSGNRSSQVARVLHKLDILTYDMKSFKSWKDAELPVKYPQEPVAGQ